MMNISTAVSENLSPKSEDRKFMVTNGNENIKNDSKTIMTISEKKNMGNDKVTNNESVL